MKVPQRHLLAWATGTGKSPAAIQLAHNKGFVILVVCPKSVVENWWREIDKWSNRNQRQWFVMSKENFKKHCDDDIIPKPDVIIVDEAHFAANYHSQIHKVLYGYVQKNNIENIYLLTATPYLSSAWNIYSLARILGVYWNWIKFKRHFFYEVRMGARTIPIQKKGIEDDIAKLVNSLGSTIKLEDCVDMPPEVDEYEYFTPTKNQLEVITKLTDTTALARYSKIHQILNGALKNDGYNKDEYYDCEKMSRVMEIIFETRKVIIVCAHLLEIKDIKNRIGNKKKTFILQGDTEDRQMVIDQINNTEDCVVLISIGVSEGYNLPTIDTMVLYSLSYNFKDWLQVRGRIRRINNPQRCVYINLIYKNTIDEAIWKNISEKKNFDVALYNFNI